MSFSDQLVARGLSGKNAKPLVLAALILGLAGFWCLRQFDGGAAGPATSSAKTTAGLTDASPSAAPVIGTAGTDSLRLTSTSANTAAPDPVADWLSAPIAQPDRDLFFSSSLVITPPATKTPTPPHTDDDSEQRRSAAFRLAAADLKLTSVVGASSGQGANGQPPTAPMALLNGRWVTCGDEVDGFKVARIDPRSVIVERDGRRLEVRMK